MENKQTAVEWIEEQILNTQMIPKWMYEILQKGKQMNKEQLKDAYKTAYNYYQSAEEFYNENYGK